MAGNHTTFNKLIKSAEAKFDTRDLVGAIADYTAAIERKPADKARLAEAYIGRGFAKKKLGHSGEAIADYDEAIRLDPADKKILASAYTNRGLAKDELGRHEEALANYDEAIRLEPELAVAWNNRGLAKDELGRHEEALANYDEAIRLEPKSVTAWNNRGSAKDNLGRYEEAIADYDEAIRIDPKNASAWNNRGSAKSALSRREGAIEDFDEAIRLEPKSATAWNNRGSAKAYLEDFDGAVKDVEEAFRLSPDNPKFLNNLAAIKAEKYAREVVEKRIGALEADTKEVKDQAEKYEDIEKINRNRAYTVMVVLVGTISSLVTVLVAPVLRPEFLSELGTIDLSNPFSPLPWITIIVLMTSPLVWVIRLLLAEANSAKIMQAEYRHLAYVEGRMLVYFPNQGADAGSEIRTDYIKATMTNSPADKLVALQNKAGAPSPSPVQNIIETIRSKARSNSPS